MSTHELRTVAAIMAEPDPDATGLENELGRAIGALFETAADQLDHQTIAASAGHEALLDSFRRIGDLSAQVQAERGPTEPAPEPDSGPGQIGGAARAAWLAELAEATRKRDEWHDRAIAAEDQVERLRAELQRARAQPGTHCLDGGVPGVLVRCPTCSGLGTLHQPDETPPAPAPEAADA